jgi:hypothetical protein
VTVTLVNVAPAALAASGGGAAAALRAEVAAGVSEAVLAAGYGGLAIFAPGMPFVANASDAGNGTLLFSAALRRRRQLQQLPPQPLQQNASVVVAVVKASL